MNIIIWIIFGALVGWVASLIMGTNGQQGAVQNIIIGIAGALLGGFIARVLGIGSVDGFDVMSLLIAVFGAMAIIAIVRAMRGRNHKV